MTGFELLISGICCVLGMVVSCIYLIATDKSELLAFKLQIVPCFWAVYFGLAILIGG